MVSQGCRVTTRGRKTSGEIELRGGGRNTRLLTGLPDGTLRPAHGSPPLHPLLSHGPPRPLSPSSRLGWMLPAGLTDVAFRPMLWRDLKPLLAGDGVTEQLASCYIEARLRCSPADLRAMWERRVFDREPLQYLTASADWRDFVLSVGPGVLIPRPGESIRGISNTTPVSLPTVCDDLSSGLASLSDS